MSVGATLQPTETASQQISRDTATIGHVVYWDIQRVDMTRTALIDSLRTNNLEVSHLRERNYRSAFIRTIRELKNQELVNITQEDDEYMHIQITDMSKRTNSETSFLRFIPQCTIQLDKDHIKQGRPIQQCIVKVYNPETSLALPNRDEIAMQVAQAYEIEKERFRSKDITSYIHLLFERHGDIVSLRDQGSVHFIPARFHTLTTNICNFVRGLPGGCKFGYLPIQDVAQARITINDSVQSELVSAITAIQNDLNQLDNAEFKSKLTEQWYGTRRKRLTGVIARIRMYENILDQAMPELAAQADLMGGTLGMRALTIAPTTDAPESSVAVAV